MHYWVGHRYPIYGARVRKVVSATPEGISFQLSVQKMVNADNQLLYCGSAVSQKKLMNYLISV
jgi:hypothetical protein